MRTLAEALSPRPIAGILSDRNGREHSEKGCPVTKAHKSWLFVLVRLRLASFPHCLQTLPTNEPDEAKCGD